MSAVATTPAAADARTLPAHEVRRGPACRDRPRVSVVIPAWWRSAQPGAAWLDETLECIRAQSYRDWEIIVVDDGSPVPVAPARTDDLTLLRQSNTGPGGARNLGCAYARGEYIAFIDADDLWRADKLERQVAYLDAHPDVVLACTGIAILGLEGPASRLRQPRLGGPAHDRIDFDTLCRENCVGSATVMLRRSALERTPGMHPTRRFGEDYGLWLRVAQLGPIGYLPEPLLLRRRHADSLMAQHQADSTWHEREREVYEDFLRDYPRLRHSPCMRAAYARLDFEQGWHLLVCGEWRGARRAMLDAIGRAPLERRNWTGLAQALLHVRPRSAR